MITMVFGLPRQGKSTYLAFKAKQALCTRRGRKRYDRVYSNFDIAGCYPFDYKDLGKYNFENCLILFDEAGLEADSRKFKSFDDDAKYFFTNHGHYGVDIIIASQGFDDVDKKIRNCTAEYYYVRKVLWWTAVLPIKQILTVDEMTHQIVTGYKLRGLIWGRFIFRPFYYKWFDTHQRRQLGELLPRHNQIYYAAPEFRLLTASASCRKQLKKLMGREYKYLKWRR